MISRLKSVGYNVIGQTCARAISLIICIYFLREVDTDILGSVNVQLMLLYDTILFLTREPIRKANTADSSISQFVNVVWLSPFICTLLSILCVGLWSIGSSSSVPLWVLLCFPISSIIESFAEPFVVFSLRFSIGSHFAVSQALLVVLKRVVAFGLIIFTGNTVYHLDIFAISQIVASLLYLLYNIFKFYQFSKQKLPELEQFKSFRSFFPTPKDGLNLEMCSQIIAEYPDSFSHFVLSNGSNFVMTFTNFMSLREIGAYDGVERLGGFLSRILFAPLEDMCYSWSYKKGKLNSTFDENREKEQLAKNVADKLPATIRLSMYYGVIASSTGFLLSRLLLSLYELDTLTTGSFLLRSYLIFMVISSVSSTLSFSENLLIKKKSSDFLMVAAAVHMGLTIILSFEFHAAGFILANSINMIIRIGYSWRHISNYLGQSTPSIFDDILPKSDVFIFLFFSFFATMFSFMIFGTAQGLSHLLAHVAVGTVMNQLVVYYICHKDLPVRAVFNEFFFQ